MDSEAENIAYMNMFIYTHTIHLYVLFKKFFKISVGE